jgi:CRP/FNR family transcriptional regulator
VTILDESLLKSIRIFAGLSPSTVTDLTVCASTRNHPAGSVLQIEGEECSHVSFVVRGAVRIYRSAPNGREQVLQNLGPGMQFNTIPVITGQMKLKASARALTDITLLHIPARDFQRIMNNRADFAAAVAADLALRLEHMTSLVEDLSLRSVRGRLARFLLDQADQGEISAQWTQDEIAARLGTVRDVIGRTMRGFMDAGLIRRDGSRLLLVDRTGLENETDS